MVIDANTLRARWKNRRQLRFSLKWLLLVVTIVCLGLGYTMARERRARQLVALNRELVDAISENVSAAPPKTSFDATSRHATDLDRFIKQQDTSERQVKVFVGGGEVRLTNDFNIELDVRDSLRGKERGPWEVANDLLNHYERGLDKVGLKKITLIGNGRHGHAAADMWQLPEHGIYFINDARVDPFTRTATVRLMIIQQERVSLW